MAKRYVTQNVMVLDTPWVRAYMMDHLSKRHIDYEILPKGGSYTEVVNYYIHKAKDVSAALRIAAQVNCAQQQQAGFAAHHAPTGGKKRHGKTTATHRLRVISLHDAQAECSCGEWHYTFSGARTREQVRNTFRKHLRAVRKHPFYGWGGKTPSVGKQVAELQTLLK